GPALAAAAGDAPRPRPRRIPVRRRRRRRGQARGRDPARRGRDRGAAALTAATSSPAARLRRDLGTLESYAALIGILIGAGIFKVTSQAWAITGPSVILGYVVLMPAILATSVPYAAFLSTPLGREPGGEYAHISRTLGGFRI